MKARKILLILTPWVVFFLALGGVGMREVGPWLVEADVPPDSVNVIFTLAGENARITYSKELFRRYPNALWIISYPNKKITQPLDKEGLDTTRIRVIDTCHNTYSEIDYLSRWIATQPDCGNLRVAVVSAPYHMRRIRMTMEKKIRKCGSVVTYLAYPVQVASVNDERYRHWYADKTLRPLVVSELQKIAYYWWRY